MRRGYPLGALFVVVTASAVLIVGAAPLLRTLSEENPDITNIVVVASLAAAWGMVVGLVVGLIMHRTPLATGLGAAAGIFIGAAAGLMALLPARELASAAAAMTGGSALIVGVALLMRPVDN